MSDRQLADAVQRVNEHGGELTGSGTVLAALDGLGLAPAVAGALRARVEISCAHPAHDLDASALTEGAAAFGDFDTYGVEGGNDRIAVALAGALDGAVRLSTPVRGVRWSELGAEVLTDHGSFAADGVVLAVPASVVDQIAFEPPLPAAKVTALAGVRYGRAAKLFVGLRSPAPPSATMSVPGRYWCYTQLGPNGSPQQFVTAFAGTSAALDQLGVAAGPERWLDSLARLRPDLELDHDSAFVSTWDQDPWVRGAYSARSASSPMDAAELARPVWRLAFAGEHTAGDWHGLMERALRSGERAAADLLRPQRAFRG